MIKQYKKKPVLITAVRYENVSDLFGFIPANKWMLNGNGTLTIDTLEGNIIAKRGDYIIKGVKGEFYPCKPDIFEMTYDEVENE